MASLSMTVFVAIRSLNTTRMAVLSRTCDVLSTGMTERIVGAVVSLPV
jgi:hypothetical protein